MADQMTPDEMRATAKRLWVRIIAHAGSAIPGDCPECTDMAAGADALDRLAGVIELHRPRDADAVTGECAEETCEHEEVCPTKVFRVCIECWNVAEASDPYFGERGITPVLWPCDTAHIARGETNEREDNA